LISEGPWQLGYKIVKRPKDEMRIPIRLNDKKVTLTFEGTPTRGELEQAAERVMGVGPLTAQEELEEYTVIMRQPAESVLTVHYREWVRMDTGLRLRDSDERWGMHRYRAQVDVETRDDWGTVETRLNGILRRHLHIERPADPPRNGQEVEAWQTYGIQLNINSEAHRQEYHTEQTHGDFVRWLRRLTKERATFELESADHRRIVIDATSKEEFTVVWGGETRRGHTHTIEYTKKGRSN
jgi:hypothetical protein